jgi:uracil-DNA glycosylase
MALVDPRVVVLLGGKAADHFYAGFAEGAAYAWGKARVLRLNERAVAAVAVHHPAYRRRKPQIVDAAYAEAAATIRAILADRRIMPVRE